MEYYLELEVGLRADCGWYNNLKKKLRPYQVDYWEKKCFHITMAFINNMSNTDEDRLIKAIGTLLDGRKACNEDFGQVDTFLTRRGDMYIIYLKPKVVSENLNSLVDSVRKCCIDNKIAIEPDFRCHITLGKINVNKVTLKKLQELIKTIQVPDFNLKLNKVNLIRRNDHKLIKNWKLKE